ncbi:MAG: exodeoxyribonuclease VII small subunit [Kiritimatiellia bacterium]|jgi:exodeoxyribonuclease VII small subunit|nr:exodeoxyribonuclease VII small subunit [Kiritimatiellia bacterium]MDP6630685.1 exodeoxyribonuclease VII small subunit [Kiritimatiellia bacterium]MDP6809452.1 exodeoxyribonuclease VII small subunit [Kiritimatiellia bacterium]MDP7023871.1 exodeoxyribonuclease VII small subunit [Kiritimatiellia bacterium]
MAAEKTKQPQGFEKSMERLEAVVSEMEGGDLSLEDMIKRFEEGQKLIGFCSKKLDEVERKIEILVKKDSGEVEAVPFEEEPPASAPEPEAEAELF